MNAQRDEILDQLRKHGWDAVPLEKYDCEWWADEMWLLSSQWSPVGSMAYLTFVVDPMYATPDRKKGQGVWAALVSSGKPLNQHSGFEVSLNQGWKERLPELLEHLSDLRGGRKGDNVFDGG